MEFVTLDLTTATEEDLLGCIESNTRIAKMNSTEISRLRALETAQTSNVKVTNLSSPTNALSDEPPYRPKDEEFEDEVDYYYSAIHGISALDLIPQLEDFLPVKKHPRYKKIILRLQAEILREIKDIKDLRMALMKEGISDKDLNTSAKDIIDAQQKFFALAALLETREATLEVQEEADVEKTDEATRLIFIPTPSGRIKVFDELESMPPEYYSELFELFSSIKNRTFKGVRRFKGDNFGGLSEVRGKMMRVVFDRIDKKSYAVLTIFAKKFDNTSGYRTSLEATAQNYFENRSGVKEKIADSEFIAIHQIHESELFRIITPTEKAPAVKAKGVQNG